MIFENKNNGYKCLICGIKYKTYSRWIEKHFEKKHKGSRIMLRKVIIKND